MKLIDRILQRWRISKAVKHLPDGSRVLDIGCFGGELFSMAGGRIRTGVGIDPLLPDSQDMEQFENIVFVKGFFPADMPTLTDRFDSIVALAVFEHVPEDMQHDFVRVCFDLLNENGKVILTVPSPFVDKILAILAKLRLIDGMSMDEHHELSIGGISDLFEKNGFLLLRHSKFQLGLNNLFVFQKGN